MDGGDDEQEERLLVEETLGRVVVVVVVVVSLVSSHTATGCRRESAVRRRGCLSGRLLGLGRVWDGDGNWSGIGIQG